jgi:hypothetical protein
MKPCFFRAALAVLVAALAVSGCSSQRLLNCPGAAILADAATRPVLKPGAAAADPSAVLYTVFVTDIQTSCVLDSHAGQTDSNVTISFRATRAPNGQAARYMVPYFLAINQGERVLNKRQFTAEVNFAPGAASVTFQTTITSTVLKLDNGHLPTEYQFLAGFEISDAERAFRAAMARYAP